MATICRRLDGIPLAIELAAARVGPLSVGQIAHRLDDSLELLTGGGRTTVPRQRTLRGTLDWSYGLLGETEKPFRQARGVHGRMDAGGSRGGGSGVGRRTSSTFSPG